ncbi:MAG: response regulator [Thermodesulfobacteriota bacterium]
MVEKTRLLIVDDNVDFAYNLADVLELKGYKAYVCPDGHRAIDTVKKERFDLILMDIKMPGMDGVETYKRIKEVSSGTVTIMMTAYAVEDLVGEALASGAYDVFYKPLDISRLLIAIEESLKEEKGRLILIVDDDKGILHNLRDILQTKGHTVFIADSGQRAIELARDKQFCIVFIDVKMPLLNGLEIYKAIKGINPLACAVMMTGYRQEVKALVEEALDSSAYTCLYKPLNMDEVLNVVDEICRGNRKGIKV